MNRSAVLRAELEIVDPAARLKARGSGQRRRGGISL